MVIKRIFGNIKIQNQSNKQDLSKINSAKEIFVKQKKSTEGENEDDNFEFRDGFNMLLDISKYESSNNFKKTKISSNEEGSDQETLKNPKSKNNKVEEIYTDFTDKAFSKNEKLAQIEKEEAIASSNTVITDTVGNKIAKSIKKNKKGNSSRGI